MIAWIRRKLAIRAAQRKLDRARLHFMSIRFERAHRDERTQALQEIVKAHRALTALHIHDLAEAAR